MLRELAAVGILFFIIAFIGFSIYSAPIMLGLNFIFWHCDVGQMLLAGAKTIAITSAVLAALYVVSHYRWLTAPVAVEAAQN